MSDAKLFEGVPHSDDPRQRLFLKTIKQMLEEDDPEDPLVVVPMRGFPASHPDLGWLQDGIEGFWKGGHIKDIDELKEVVAERIGHAVQRCKDWSIGLNDNNYLDVRFKTKDDYGYYAYEFSCQLYETHPVNDPIGEGVKVIDDHE